MITGIFHCALRTADLPATILFYTQILGLLNVPRPPSIKFEGAWLALPTPTMEAIIHVYAGATALDTNGKMAANNEQGIVDHLSLAAQGFLQMRATLANAGISWREQNRAGELIWQMFFHDPNGLKIELTFHQAAEPGLPVAIAPQNRYKAEERFFNAEQYGSLMNAH